MWMIARKNQELAYRINVDGPKNLSVASNEVGAVLVHISSDYVYDGRKKEPYLEEDDYAPQSVYGMTKMKGDAYVTELLINILLLEQLGYMEREKISH